MVRVKEIPFSMGNTIDENGVVRSGRKINGEYPTIAEYKSSNPYEEPKVALRFIYEDKNGDKIKKKEYRKIHRLVAEAFIPNPNKYDDVEFIDGNIHNAHVSNLRWTLSTKQQLLKDGTKLKLIPKTDNFMASHDGKIYNVSPNIKLQIDEGGYVNYANIPSDELKEIKSDRVNNSGYKSCSISYIVGKSIKGKLKKKRIHKSVQQVIATVFLENPYGHKHVRHKDGNKLNNHVSNLEWASLEECINKAIAFKNAKPDYTLSYEEHIDVIKAMLNGVPIAELIKKYSGDAKKIIRIRDKTTQMSKDIWDKHFPNLRVIHKHEDIRNIVDDLKNGMSDNDIAKKYNTYIATIRRIKHSPVYTELATKEDVVDWGKGIECLITSGDVVSKLKRRGARLKYIPDSLNTFVSDCGGLYKTKDKYNTNKDGYIEYERLILKVPKITKNKHGYPTSNIPYGDGGKVKFRSTLVHTLVADAFVDNVDDKPMVMRLDGIADNNHYTNLKWATKSEILQSSYDTGKRQGFAGDKNVTNKISDDVALKIMKMFIAGKSNRYIMDSLNLNISMSHLAKIRRGEVFKDIKDRYFPFDIFPPSKDNLS